MPETPTKDAVHAYRVLDLVVANPAHHNQRMWWDGGNVGPEVAEPTCGTAGCWAGWAVALKPGWSIQRVAVVLGDPDGYFVAVSPDDRILDINEAAEEILSIGELIETEYGTIRAHGVDEDGSPIYLFYGHHDVEDLARLIPLVFGPRPDGA